MAIELKVPAMGESISEVEIGEWKKAAGDFVHKDETIAILESEKASVELPSPAAGVLVSQAKTKGQTASVGEVIGMLDDTPFKAATAPAKEAASEPAAKPVEKAAEKAAPRVMPAAERLLAEHGLSADQVTPTGPGGRVLKEDVLRQVEANAAKPVVAPAPLPAADSPPPVKSEPVPRAPMSAPEKTPGSDRSEEVVPMSRLRRTVAARLVEAQHNAALLTTFNEIDMTAVLGLRKELGEAFQARHNVKLGFMSFFVKASVDALTLIPQVNAEIRGKDVVYHRYCDIGVAIGGGKGLVVPILRHAEKLSFAAIELAIADFARRAKENKLQLTELQGGTFTISNGGVYGSLLSTPIVNPPQSGVLGMHAIQERPVAKDGQVVIRPMMYVALTYDHRMVDGREAVTFLKRIKEGIENPARLLLQA